MVESAIVLYKNEIIDASLGTPVNVEFNFEKIWAFKKTQNPFLIQELHFVHVHPKGFLNYSATDLDCIQGFNLAFGNKVLFSIICFEDSNLNSQEHSMRTYFFDKEMVNVTDSHILKREHILILKTLSYYGASEWSL